MIPVMITVTVAMRVPCWQCWGNPYRHAQPVELTGFSS